MRRAFATLFLGCFAVAGLPACDTRHGGMDMHHDPQAPTLRPIASEEQVSYLKEAVAEVEATLATLRGPDGPALAQQWGLSLEEAIAVQTKYRDNSQRAIRRMTVGLTPAEHIENLDEMIAEARAKLELLVDTESPDVENQRARIDQLSEIREHYKRAGTSDPPPPEISLYTSNDDGCPGHPLITSTKVALVETVRYKRNGRHGHMDFMMEAMHYVYPESDNQIFFPWIEMFGDAEDEAEGRGAMGFGCKIGSPVVTA